MLLKAYFTKKYPSSFNNVSDADFDVFLFFQYIFLEQLSKSVILKDIFLIIFIKKLPTQIFIIKAILKFIKKK